MVSAAYGRPRLTESEVLGRLRKGSADVPNRVLHLAFVDGDRLVGCISSTYTVPWCPTGCGHWGLLVVGVALTLFSVGIAVVVPARSAALLRAAAAGSGGTTPTTLRRSGRATGARAAANG